MPSTGELRHRVTVQQATDTRDAYGEPDPTWSTYKERSAKISPMNGSRFFAGKQFDTDITHEIVLRHTAGITTKMRVLFGTRVFEIDSVINPQERNRWTVLMCREAI